MLHVCSKICCTMRSIIAYALKPKPSFLFVPFDGHDIVSYACGMCVCVCVFCFFLSLFYRFRLFFSMLGNSLTPSKVFTSLTLFNQLRLPLFFLPSTLNAFAEAKVRSFLLIFS